MKYLIFLLFPLSLSAAPINQNDWNTLEKLANDFTINSGIYTNTDGTTQPVLYVKWQRTETWWGPGGLRTVLVDYCSITKSDEFMAVPGNRKLSEALIAPYPASYLGRWEHGKSPANANVGCLQ